MAEQASCLSIFQGECISWGPAALRNFEQELCSALRLGAKERLAPVESCHGLCKGVVLLVVPDPVDWSLPGSFTHGIFQARVLEWGVNETLSLNT